MSVDLCLTQPEASSQNLRQRGRAGAVAHHGGHRPGVAVDLPWLQHAQFVAFRVGQHHPRHIALADVDGFCAEVAQPRHQLRLMLRRLAGQVQVQAVFGRLGLGHGYEHDRQRDRIRVAVPGRPHVDLFV